MVEATNKSQKFEDVLTKFTDMMKTGFGELKTNLPEQQMRQAEKRIPEMLALKSKCSELIEKAYAIFRELQNTVMTELEKDAH